VVLHLDQREATRCEHLRGDPQQPLAVLGRGDELEEVEAEEEVAGADLLHHAFRVGDLGEDRGVERVAVRGDLPPALVERLRNDVHADELGRPRREVDCVGAAAAAPLDHAPERAVEADRARAAVEHVEVALADLVPEVTIFEDVCFPPVRVRLPLRASRLRPVVLRVRGDPRVRMGQSDPGEDPLYEVLRQCACLPNT
jgi:hypothetical protein